MDEYQELVKARKDMLSQKKTYRPSSFWDQASDSIFNAICIKGIHKFRSIAEALYFFVPTYGNPGNTFTKSQISKIQELFKRDFPSETKTAISLDQFLNGCNSALADYRVLLAADNKNRLPYLHQFSESFIGDPIEQFEFDGKKFSRSSLNYMLGLAFLKKYLGDDIPKTVLEIGGGFGSLGEVLLSSGIKGLRYIDIDIPPTSYTAQYYLSTLIGEGKVTSYTETANAEAIDISSLSQVSVLCSWQIEKLHGKIDLFVNFISFQEMEPHIVKNYLGHVARLEAKWILLRNMREGKQLISKSSVGVHKQIFTKDYLKMLPQYELIDLNVVPFGFKTVDGFHSELIILKRK